MSSDKRPAISQRCSLHAAQRLVASVGECRGTRSCNQLTFILHAPLRFCLVYASSGHSLFCTLSRARDGALEEARPLGAATQSASRPGRVTRQASALPASLKNDAHTLQVARCCAML